VEFEPTTNTNINININPIVDKFHCGAKSCDGFLVRSFDTA